MINFTSRDILYEDNHLMVVNKRAGQLVQADQAGTQGLEDAIKAFIRRRDEKPGDVFLGVVHRIDRPVSGAVVFAKTSKALVRLNEMIRLGQIDKRYWAITEEQLPSEEGTLVHHIVRDGKTNRSHAHSSPQPKKDSKEARLDYRMLAGSTNYYLYEVTLHTGRHHQIRAQFSREGAPIRGDLKYGAKRSLPPIGGKAGAAVSATEGPHGAAETFGGRGSRGRAAGRSNTGVQPYATPAVVSAGDSAAARVSAAAPQAARASVGAKTGGDDAARASLGDGGGISLHSRRVSFIHPVKKEPITVTAPVPEGDNLWKFFQNACTQ